MHDTHHTCLPAIPLNRDSRSWLTIVRSDLVFDRNGHKETCSQDSGI